MTRLVLFCVVVLLAAVDRDKCLAQDANAPPDRLVSGAQAERSKEVIEKYLKNRDEFKRYACAMAVEITDEDLRNPRNSTFREVWYFHAFDREKMIRRQDELIPVVSLDLDGSEIGMRERAKTMFVSEDKVVQFYNGKRNTVLSKGAEPEDWNKIWPQAYFHPWRLPLTGTSSFRNQDKYYQHRKDVIRTMIDRFRIRNFQENLQAVAIEYDVSRKYPITERILFGTSSGMMPTRAESVNYGENFPGIMDTKQTEWKNYGGHWYPHRVDMRTVSGPPKKPASIMTSEVRLYWVFDEHVPEHVFDVDGQMDAKPVFELMDGIVDAAINR